MSLQPLSSSASHTSWLAKLQPLVGQAYDPTPGRGCWLLVRDGLRLLGVPMPERYEESMGLASSMGAAPQEGIRVGDVLMLWRTDGTTGLRSRHVGLLLGNGRVLHTSQGGAVVDGLHALRHDYQSCDVLRMKYFLNRGGGA